MLIEYDALHAPSHWRAEAANGLWAYVFRGDMTRTDAEERMQALMSAAVIETDIKILMQAAFAIAVETMVTLYDALYVALAIARRLPLVTADRTLIAKLHGRTGASVVWIGDLPPVQPLADP